jgi:hypothetical protein
MIGNGVLVSLLFLFASSALADRLEASGQQAADPPEETVPAGAIVGINGHYRVGRMTAIRIADVTVAEGLAAGGGRSELRLETLDGDGVRVQYDPFPPFDVPLANPREIGYVVPGSEAVPLVIRRVIEGEESVVLTTRFPIAGIPSRGPSMIPPTMPWVLVVGDTLGVDSIGSSNVLVDKLARIAVTKIDSASSLPSLAVGYDGVDMVMINATGLSVLAEMTTDQRSAIAAWLQQGGRIFACLGESTERVHEAASWLTDLLPIDDLTVSRYDPAALETFTSSQTPLEVFRGIKLPKRQGRSLLLGRTTQRVSAVLAAEYVVGFGRVTVVAADLDHASFARWTERLDFVTQLVGDLFAEQTGDRDASAGSTAFADLAGQMRGVLDQFVVKPSFSFSLVSVIVMLLIAAIGPLDYLLINRVLGKPLLGWLSFPLIAIALSVFLVMQAAPRMQAGAVQSPNGSLGLLRANQVQVTDIDLVDGTGRGFAWCYLYSHDPTKVDVNYAAVGSLESLTESASATPKSIVYPMGYPGKEFGGIQLADENAVLPGYRVRPKRSGGTPGGMETTIKGLTLAPRSSKSIASEVTFAPRVGAGDGVSRRPGSELLRGEFVNPLPLDVLDGRLIYGNWVYLLPTRVPAGASVGSLSDLRQKNFRWRLTRKQSLDTSVAETTSWSPGDFSDVDRVTEMIMFHRAAGGQLYTGLRHDALGELDLSDVLVEDRCIFVGRTERPLFDFEVRESESDSDRIIEPGGNVLSVVRVVLPVRSTRLD